MLLNEGRVLRFPPEVVVRQGPIAYLKVCTSGVPRLTVALRIGCTVTVKVKTPLFVVNKAA
jgi:hypothetical protein